MPFVCVCVCVCVDAAFCSAMEEDPILNIAQRFRTHTVRQQVCFISRVNGDALAGFVSTRVFSLVGVVYYK